MADATQTQWQLASVQMLEHLQRLGLDFLPTPSGDPRELFPEWGQVERIGQEQLGAVAGPRPSAASVGGVVASGTSPANATPVSGTPSVSGTQQVPVHPSVSSAPKTPSVPASPSTPVVPGGVAGRQVAPLFTRTAKTLEQVQTVPTAWDRPKLSLVEREQAFAELSQRVEACRLCSNIACQRQKTVFGTGPLNTRFVMVGEAPGSDEDRQGVPFVGEAGKLLDKILLATQIPREQVYILNTLKCRPPNNRTPTELEMENCRPFLEAQLEVLQPDYIVCWGVTAQRAILGTNEPLGRIRGKWYRYKQAKVMVTFHPAYLLRMPEAKREAWADMQMLMRDVGIPIPGGGTRKA